MVGTRPRLPDLPSRAARKAATVVWTSISRRAEAGQNVVGEKEPHEGK